MLENFPSYITNLADEIENRRYYKQRGRPPYSSAMICCALMSIAFGILLNKLQTGGVDSINVIFLRKKEELSSDIVLMVDEMCLQKGTRCHGGEYIGADEDGNLYKGIVVLMIAGLKKSIPYIIKACPEISICRDWLADEIAQNISTLCNNGFNVRAVESSCYR